MRSTILAVLLLLAPGLGFGAANPILTVNSAKIDYGTSQVTLSGSGFEPVKKGPTVLFNGAPLTIDSFSNTQIVATLPANTTAGTYGMIVANSIGEFNGFDLTYGSSGPQGPAGPAGVNGMQGPMGLPGLMGPPGANGAQGPIGPAGQVGAAGQAGPQGLMGNPGPTGPAGAAGPAGPAGVSAIAAVFGVNTNEAQINTVTPATCLVGSVTLMIGNTFPGDILPANGQLLQISDYIALFNLTGINFGGDGQLTFALPDLRSSAPNNTSYGICVVGSFP